MARGYYDLPADDKVRYHRVPDNGLSIPTQAPCRTAANSHLNIDSKYSKSPTSTSKKSHRVVQVDDHRDHNKARYLPAEPRASKATYEDYKKTSDREGRR